MRNIILKTYVVVGVMFFAGSVSAAQEKFPEWNLAGFDQVKELAKKQGVSGLLITIGSKPVLTYGIIDESHPVHSVRKAFLSALVGQHLGTGTNKIDLQATLQDLNIDDYPIPLVPIQKQVRVIDLVRSVSGVNHPAAAERFAGVDVMAKAKERLLGTQPRQPGTTWAYNNWDYNVLTTVFEKQTGRNVYYAFKKGIADPLAMQDFNRRSVTYLKELKYSQHGKAGFRMSVRDMARFGQLYLQRGQWNGEQLIPSEWVDRITNDYVLTNRKGMGSGHGYLWWVPADQKSRDIGIPEGSFTASGYAGQRIMVFPKWDMVITQQVNTDPYRSFCRDWAKKANMNYIETLKFSRRQCNTEPVASTEFCAKCRFSNSRDFEKLVKTVIAARKN